MARTVRSVHLHVVAGSALGSQSGVAELLDAVAAGDDRAWTTLIDRFGPLVRAVARRCGLSPDEVADVAQTTWELLVRHHRVVRDPDCLGGWLRTVATREAIRVSQRRGRVLPTEDLDGTALTVVAGGDSVEDEVLRAERVREVEIAMTDLSTPCRRLLALLSADPMPSYQEIAERTGMRVGSIGPTRARCLDCLQRHLRRHVS